MNVIKLIQEIEDRGITLTVEGSFLVIEPSEIPDDILETLKAFKPEIIDVIRFGRKPPSMLEGLRRFAPGMWELVRFKDGTTGLLHGVTRHGLLITKKLGSPILTIDPTEVLEVINGLP